MTKVSPKQRLIAFKAMFENGKIAEFYGRGYNRTRRAMERAELIRFSYADAQYHLTARGVEVAIQAAIQYPNWGLGWTTDQKAYRDTVVDIWEEQLRAEGLTYMSEETEEAFRQEQDEEAELRAAMDD